MGQSSSIEWTDATWNPVAGCTLVSAGCTNCYAMRMAARLEAMGQAKYVALTRKVNGNAVWTGKINFDERTLLEPLTWKKPRRVFVNSMSDLFHQGVPFEFVDRVFAVMALTPQHTYQILTKRPERMAECLSRPGVVRSVCTEAGRLMIDAAPDPDTHLGAWRKWHTNDSQTLTAWTSPGGCAAEHFEKSEPGRSYPSWVSWPLPNVWLGTSVEDQARADERIPHLLRCPATVRFLSAEPLLGAVDLRDMNGALARWREVGGVEDVDAGGVHWVIVGGESGPGARPMDPAWVRALRDQCHDAGVAFFFKQWGDWKPADVVKPDTLELHFPKDGPSGPNNPEWHDWPGGWKSARVGKKAAGRLLDEVEWNEFPKRG